MERIDMIQAAQTVQPQKSSQTSDSKDTGFTKLLKEKVQTAETETEQAENIGKRPVQKEEAEGTDQENDQLEDPAVLAQGLPVWGMAAQLLAETMLKLGTGTGEQDQSGAQTLNLNTALNLQETGTGNVADQGTVMEVIQQHTEVTETKGEQQNVINPEILETAQESQALSEELLQAMANEPEAEQAENDSKPAAMEATDNVQKVVTESESEQSSIPVVKAASSKEQQAQADAAQDDGAKMAAQSEQPVTYRTYSTAENKSSETLQVKTEPETLPADVGETLASRLPQKNGQLTIDLEPASLGKITVKVMYEAGRAEVSIMASNPKTLELLSKNAGDIAGILQDKTGQETVVYTPQSQPQSWEEQGSADNSGQRENHQESRQRKDRQQDSFAQQLRLGLV